MDELIVDALVNYRVIGLCTAGALGVKPGGGASAIVNSTFSYLKPISGIASLPSAHVSATREQKLSSRATGGAGKEAGSSSGGNLHCVDQTTY